MRTHSSPLASAHPPDPIRSLLPSPPRAGADSRRFWHSLQKSWASRYGLALVCLLVAFGLQSQLLPFMSSGPFLFFYGAVMVAGWWGGWGPALLVTALSIAVVDSHFLPPRLSIQMRSADILALSLFGLLSVFITKLNVTLSRALGERAALLEREHQAHAAAEEARSRLHTIFMQAPAQIFFLRGASHVFDFSNARNSALLEQEATPGTAMREGMFKLGEQDVLGVLDRVYATGEPFQGSAVPLRVPQPDGKEKEVFYNLTYQPTRDERGQVEGIAGFGFDVTDLVHARQRAEALATELRQAEFRTRVLAEVSTVLASSLDHEATLRNLAKLVVPALADWCFVDLAEPNGTFRRLEVAHARPEDAPVAAEVINFQLMPEGNPRHPPTAALLRGEAILFEEMTPAHIKRSAHNENHARVMLATGLRSFIAVPLVVRGHTLGVFSFFTSFSNRRYTQADLAFGLELAYRAALSMENARLYREAQEAIRLRDEFLSIASHELKTPLTPLSLKLQALARELERHPDAIPYSLVKGYVDTGARQVKKLAELVGDLLDVSRIAAGRLALELEDVDLGALLREVAQRYEPHATRAGSVLLIEGEETELVGRWDRLRLEQVVTNLIDNAVKYGAGKPITLTLEQGPTRARLRVRDQGIGIAPEHLPRLFGRFERAVSERHYGGLGLGLYITRTLVEAMGGRVRVESEQGRGSTFTVDLPRERTLPVDVQAAPPQ
ncbi:ATP-binding protein [Myxococcus stipitatus]|uniref:sensor histidine kinase n=1 Tax=Myxococcus stipitatus TaxID=83455 RepID=UPI001F1B598C|nr:ATP-binding protein [Myxococcus stipitatus]MCE9668805.1 ATP-binding protein [Myxococcus stipitatus]